MEEIKPQVMSREKGASTVEHYKTTEPVDGVTTFAVWAPAERGDKNLPVVLFQSGYGSDTRCHADLLQQIASAGFIVIAPARSDDQRCGCLGIFGFLNGTSCSAMSVDGAHLALALEYAKNPENQWMDSADTSKVIMAGFSMGGQEVIHAQARFPEETKAVVIVSGSVMVPLATFLGWNPCLQPLAGGSCTICSDTPVGLCGMPAAVRSWGVPSLFVTSDKDALMPGNYRAASIAGEIGGGEATLVTFKDEALDLANPITRAHSPWKYYLDFSCYGGPLFGLRQHFALAQDSAAESGVPVVSFLRKVFYGEGEVVSTDKTYEINERAAPAGVCHPFPLFKSCCAC